MRDAEPGADDDRARASAPGPHRRETTMNRCARARYRLPHETLEASITNRGAWTGAGVALRPLLASPDASASRQPDRPGVFGPGRGAGARPRRRPDGEADVHRVLPPVAHRRRADR